MNVLSLFDGMSCGQIALERAGIKVDNYFASEIDKYTIKVTQYNYPNTIQLGNVVDISAKDLPKIDLLIGGSPCQSFSIVGDRTGFDGKSKLFWEYVRLLKEIKPKYFLFENVEMKKCWIDIISIELNIKPIKINSNVFSAQNRPRLYWTNIQNISEPIDKNILLKDIIENNVPERYFLSDKAISKIERNSFKKEYNNINTAKTGTLIAGYYKTPGGSYYFDDGYRKRRYTPIECERLQTVPDNYTSCVSNSQRYKMLGNGWTVDVIAHIFKDMLRKNDD